MNLPNRLLALVLLTLALAACQTQPQTGLTPEQIAVLKREGFQPTDDGWEFGLSSKVLFGNNLDAINHDSRANLERIGRVLREAGLDRLRLEGHTDSYGEPDYNRELSVRRANAVAEVLISAGMRPENLEIRGLGMSKPVADNNTPDGRMENRRVAIIVPVE
ncbi:OmpA family protein [Zestomonas carbonaria]|uniref:OmpA family protein n=1 Tax=Zestomonas carbonaria TaxID=2762745 RepID=UPI002E2A356E|nr:OmpA family protein [Pseudomonas carbonaria]